MKIVFDIGGTNMRVASVDGLALKEIRKVPTPRDPKEGIATFVQLAKELSGGTVIAVAGDFPGRVTHGCIEAATNLPLWEGTDVAAAISRELSAPVRVLNDAILVGYGELHNGAGRGFKKLAYLTVSTGFGGAFINESDLSNSKILGDDFPELKPRLESQISGMAVKKKFGIEPKELDSVDERNKLADILASGISEIAEFWKPDVFVIGGSMITGVNPIPLERVRERFSAIPVQMAELGDNGGLIGAGVLMRQI